MKVPKPVSPIAAVLALAMWLQGCAWLEPATQLRAGQTNAEVRRLMGPPSAVYPMPQGQRRLEYRRGPAGHSTWMVDLGSDGRVLQAEQVLTMATFERVVDGMSREALLRLLGQPAHRQREWRDKETWSWRYTTYACLWFRVTLSPEGLVMGGGGHMPDPACDVNDTPRAPR